jgi:hypothetical protein
MELLIIDADAAGNAFCMENKFTVGIIITARDFTIQSPRVADKKVHCYDEHSNTIMLTTRNISMPYLVYKHYCSTKRSKERKR